MRPGRDPDFSPSERDIWVVTLLLSKLTYAIHKAEGSAKIGKLEGFRDVVLFDDIPTVHLRFESGELLTLERGTPPRQGTHVLAASSDIVERILSPPGQTLSSPPSGPSELFGMRQGRVPR